MYSNPGGRQADYLSTSPQWQTINRSMNALVDDGEERARAASAPPPQQLTGFQYHDRGQTPVDQWTDIRCDDEYENFYKASTAAGRRLPPPLDAGAMYSQLPNHLQHLTAQQQLLAARASPNPTGLETINERPGSNINPQILQVLNQINQERGASPAPPAGLDYTNSIPQMDNGLDNQSAMLQQLIAAAGSLSLSATPQPPQSLTPPINAGTPPLPSATPPLPPQMSQHNPQAMANAAAYAATIAAGQQNTSMQDFRRTMEWNTVYSAAYQAALHQQQAATQNLLLSQGQGHMASQLAGQYAPQHSHVAAQIAGQMAMNPSFLGTQNIGQVAAAAATAAVQNMMGRGAPAMYGDYDRGDRDDRRNRMGGNRRGNRRDLDRDRDRDDDGGSNFRYQTLEEVIGQVMTVAKDQNGCRFLQRKFDEGGHEAIATVFPEILDNLIDLMTDPFGNYLTQKLLDRCSEQQRLEVLRRAAQDGSLVKVALNTHGTRAVQKLIETLQGPEQIQLVIKALKPGVVALIRDLNGNHVIQRCLQRLGPEDSQFVYDAASEHAVEIATHRHGCCVLQRCIDFATSSQKDELVAKIVDNAYALSQDGFGNYCLQYVLELDQVETSKEILRRLTTHFPELSQQKFSSNVVEKCLKLKNPEYNEFKEIIVREIIQSPFLSRLLQDPYANFVIQTALGESKDTLHTELVEAIRPYLPSLRGTPFGKKILAKINIKL